MKRETSSSVAGTVTPSSPTPGPWQVGDGLPRPQTPRVMAKAVGVKGNMLVEVANCGHSGMHLDEQEADARLIAAAPTLLTMLARVMDQICMTECGMSHLALLDIEQARTAIRQAKGG